METKKRKGPVQVTAAPTTTKPKAKNKNRYYASKAKAKAKKPTAKIEANKKFDGNIAAAKDAEKAREVVIDTTIAAPEPAVFVWQGEEQQKGWFARLLDKLLPSRKKKFLQE